MFELEEERKRERKKQRPKGVRALGEDEKHKKRPKYNFAPHKSEKKRFIFPSSLEIASTCLFRKSKAQMEEHFYVPPGLKF